MARANGEANGGAGFPLGRQSVASSAWPRATPSAGRDDKPDVRVGEVDLGSRTRGRITEATRLAIRQSTLSLAATAKALGVNKKTVRLWRGRGSLDTRKSGPSRSLSLTRDEETIVIHFRINSMLPLDDCLYVLQADLPHLTRSTLHRCFSRHGLNKLPIERFNRDTVSAESQLAPGNLLFQTQFIGVAGRLVWMLSTTDLQCRWSHGGVFEKGDPDAARKYLDAMSSAYPYPITTLTVPMCGDVQDLDPGLAEINAAAKKHGFRCIERPADYPWQAEQIERVRERLHRQRERGHIHPDIQAVKDHVDRFSAIANFQRKLKTLGGRTPFSFACEHLDIDKAAFRRKVLGEPELAGWWKAVDEHCC